MKIEIVAIGDEILLGNTVNTNATFLSLELKKLGYRVCKHSVCSDDEKLLKENLKNIFEQNDLIITTGGLGPTFDDKTKKVVSDLLGITIESNKELEKDLYKRFEKNKYIKEQANVPKGTIILKNEIGTASGFIFEKNNKVLIFLPGVPCEMKKMFFSYVVDYLKKKYVLNQKIYQEFINICLLKENEVEKVLEQLRKINKEIEIGIYPSFANVRVSFTILEKDEEKAKSKIKPLKDKLISEFKTYIYDAENIEEALKNILISNKKTLALAESCSGGAMSASLTKRPNASAYFLGSIVTYSNELKENILKVSKDTLKKKGAVSIETAQEMVKGIFNITKADYAVAISGIAGPGGATAEKPIGTVCIAIGERNKKIESKKIYVKGMNNRELIIKYCVVFSLSLLWVKINSELT